MPALSQEQKDLMGEPIIPFQRNTRGKTIEKDLKEGEGHNGEFLEYIHDGIDNNKPRHNYAELTDEEVEAMIKNGGKYEEKCFLWVLDDVSIKILRETTRNILRTDKPIVCHTNITGCQKAIVGGEMFFATSGEVYINFFSDRYGNPSAELWAEAKKYIESVGYSPLKDILELIGNE
ncbi:hypothetical protein [Maribacter sp. 2304DJ31-5]|uniref:hypothetical protein n=1 Tax=Maribacter sp. 2304DJ31-5 TaxID=3386273 RepID=UPI0039BCA0F5